MLNFTSPITESHTYNNFSMKEKTPVAKINLRGDLETILNHVDVTIHKKTKEDVDLYVRRSFSDHLWAWIKDSSRFA